MRYGRPTPKFQLSVSTIAVAMLLLVAVLFDSIVTQIRQIDLTPVGNYAVQVPDGSPSASLGDLRKTGRSTYFRASIDFVAKRDGSYPNLMQTDDGNEGVRIELTGKYLMVKAGKGNAENLTMLLGEIELGKPYHLEIEALDRGYVSATLGEGPRHFLTNSSIRLPGANFRIGDGHVVTRRWQGDIQSFEMWVGSSLSFRLGAEIALSAALLLMLPLTLILWTNRETISTAIRLTIKGAVHRGPALRVASAPSKFPLFWLSLIPTGITALYSASYAFMYLPITEGWFHVYVRALKQGLFMYRDLNLLLPPLYPITLLAFQTVFGDGFWALRLLGVLLTAAIATVTFDLLRFIFDRWVSAFAAVVAVVFYQSGNAYIGYDFTQFVTLYMLIGCLGVVRYARCRNALFLFMAGFFLGLATLNKQSNGGVVSIGMTFVSISTICYVARSSIIRHSMVFFSGAMVPLVAVLVWLARNGALFDFLDQTVFHAASAKGSSALFSGWIWRLFVEADFAGANVVALLFIVTTIASMGILALFVAAVKSAFVAVDSQSEFPAKVFAHSFLGAAPVQPSHWNPRAVAASLGFLLLGLTIVAQKLNFQLVMPFFGLPNKYNMDFFFIVIAFNVYCIGGFVSITGMFRQHATRTLSLLIVSVFGLLLMMGNGTSASLSEISAFLGIGVLVAAGMSMSSRSVIMPTFVALIAVNACGSLIASKFSGPYSWWGISTGEIGKNNCAPVFGQLHGLCMDERKAKAIAATVDAIAASTTLSGEVLSFPNVPIFALMANRNSFGRSPIPWFDFMSQDEGQVLLKKLHESPPQAIVVARLPELVYDEHEKAFNSGAIGVHRQILQYIDELLRMHYIALVVENTIDGVNVQVFRYVHDSPTSSDKITSVEPEPQPR